mgnify:CR=1 FL=1
MIKPISVITLPMNSKIYTPKGFISDGSTCFMIVDFKHHVICVSTKENLYALSTSTFVRKYKDGYKIILE